MSLGRWMYPAANNCAFTRAHNVKAVSLPQASAWLRMRITAIHHITGIFAALAAKLRHNELNQPIRFVPLTVFKTHTVNEVGLAGGETVYFVDYTGCGHSMLRSMLCNSFISVVHMDWCCVTRCSPTYAGVIMLALLRFL